VDDLPADRFGFEEARFMNEPTIALIVAVAENGVIGRDGKLPWRIPEDMKWFRERTAGRPLIMGRKTWESFPKRPLPGRTNIVITRDASYTAEGAVVVTSLKAALDAAYGEDPEEIMVIGGAEIYRAALSPLRGASLPNVRLRGGSISPACTARLRGIRISRRSIARPGPRRSWAFIPRQPRGRSATVSSS
jgi:Dihydrofolate reductase